MNKPFNRADFYNFLLTYSDTRRALLDLVDVVPPDVEMFEAVAQEYAGAVRRLHEYADILAARDEQQAEPNTPVFEVGSGWLKDARDYPRGTMLYARSPAQDKLADLKAAPTPAVWHTVARNEPVPAPNEPVQRRWMIERDQPSQVTGDALYWCGIQPGHGWQPLRLGTCYDTLEDAERVMRRLVQTSGNSCSAVPEPTAE